MKSLPILILLCLFISSCSGTKKMADKTKMGNYFEGYVTYKHTSVKPDMVPEEKWNEKMKEVTGEQGFILQKNYYKPNNFAAEINSGLEVGKQIYNPIDSLHYAWQLNTKTAYTEDKNAESLIKIKEIIDLDTTAVINNIKCRALKVNYTFGYATIWYNSNVINFNPMDYRGTLFDREVIERIKSLPIKVEVAEMLVMEMVEYNAESVDGSLFKIPAFDEVIESPSF